MDKLREFKTRDAERKAITEIIEKKVDFSFVEKLTDGAIMIVKFPRSISNKELIDVEGLLRRWTDLYKERTGITIVYLTVPNYIEIDFKIIEGVANKRKEEYDIVECDKKMSRSVVGKPAEEDEDEMIERLIREAT